MGLTQDERDIMVQLELDRAERIVGEFEIYVNNSLWNTLTNRMYYAVFHAATALLIKHGLHAGTHQGVFALLSRHFIKDGVMSQDEGRLFSRLATMREKGDYNCFIDAAAEDVLPLLEPVKVFIAHIRELCAK